MLLVLLVGAGTTVAGLSRGAAAASCGPERVPLRVATSPVLLDVLRRQAALFDAGTSSLVAGRCTRTSVVAVAPSRFADTVLAGSGGAGGTASASTPHVWVPDSQVWATVAARRPEVAALLPHAHPVVASTPVVVAVPRPMAEALGWPARQPTWSELTALARDRRGWARLGHPEWGPVDLAWSDATTTTAGLAATLAVYDRADAQAAADDDVRRSLLAAQSGLTALAVDPAKALAPLRDRGLTTAEALRRTPMFPWTEQQVLRFDAGDPQVPLVAVYPAGGTAAAEVPLLTLDVPGVTDAQRRAVERFAAFLVQPAARAALAADGWRSPQLELDASAAQGVLPAQPSYTPPAPERSTVARALQSWSALDRQGSVLVLLDVSGSMAEKVPSLATTRLRLVQQAVAESLPLFSDRSSVGLWTFSRRQAGDRDWTAVVPLGPLSRRVGGPGGPTAREALRDAVDRLRAHGDTGLYDSTLAAVRAARAGWRPGTDVVVVVSDGRDDDPGGVGLRPLLDRLRTEADPRRPVQVLTIALGPAADAGALRQIAAAGGGTAYSARSPEDLEQVFLTALTG